MEDPCCLMTVFKGDFYYHFETTPEDLGQIPLELLWQMEEQFLAAVGAGQEKSLKQLTQEWRSYPLWQETPGKSLNATLSWIPSAKKEYLIQRAGGDHVLYLPTACELLKTLYQEG